MKINPAYIGKFIILLGSASAGFNLLISKLKKLAVALIPRELKGL
jgi:hypothetical protein